MRLISDNSLKERVSEHTLSKDEYERFCEIIDAEPTAYDVDKVAKELEELRNKDICDYMDCDVCLYNKKCGVVTDQSNNLKWDKAIEIVKQGGVSDDVCEWIIEETGVAWHCDNECTTYNPAYAKNLKIILDDFECKCPYCGKMIKVVDNDK